MHLFCLTHTGAMEHANPFTTSPFSSRPLKLVEVPSAPETHERRRSPRAYLADSSNPLDRLVTTLMGSTPKSARKIEVVREVPAADELEEAEDAPALPKWGIGRG